MPHFVYTFPLADLSSFKIGVSTHPPQRLADLSRYYTFDLKTLLTLQCPDMRIAFQIENTLHNVCATKQVLYSYDGGTEFFDYSAHPVVKDILTSMARLDGFSLEAFQVDSFVLPAVDEAEQTLNALVNTIRSKRISCNLTQEQLALMCGVSTGTIKGLEGCSRSTNLLTLLKVLKSLDLDEALTSLVPTLTTRKRARGTELS